MSMPALDEVRLRRLLGGAELANLRRRLRARYESGTPRDEFTLTDLEASERRALAGLLGRRSLAADSMRVRGSELDEALSRAGIAGTLREALEFLDGPLRNGRAAARACPGGCGRPRAGEAVLRKRSYARRIASGTSRSRAGLVAWARD